MELRDFGKRCGLQVAPVSIGAMRLPEDAGDSVALIRRAIDAGMRYIDTSRGYGESEFKLGRALRDGYRERVCLSSKCSPWIKKVRDDDDGSADSVRRRIAETLLRLDVDYLDFYQVWNIYDAAGWELATRKGGMVDGIRRAMDEKLVRHTGFTSHEKPENLLRYLPQADWCEVLLLSFNLLNKEYRPVLAAARALGIGTVVMNPVGGGRLAQESPVLLKLAADVGAVSVPDLALRYVLGHPDVDTVLCGMTRATDVDDSVASAQRPPLTAEQIARVDAFIEGLSRQSVKFCTQCNYCQPCPQGVQIPRIMDLIYEDRFLGLKQAAKDTFRWLKGQAHPEACTKCGKCELKCTQGIKIIHELEYALKEYGEVT
jgi:hypothetical protein